MQLAIVIAIVGSNNAWHWTPNGYAAGVVAVGAAFLATFFISELLRFCRWLAKRTNGNAALSSRSLKRVDQQEPLSSRIVRQRSGHELVGEIGLDRSGHDRATGQRLGNAEQARIEQVKRIGPLRRP